MLVLVSSSGLASAQGEWELIVCADPANAPVSTEAGDGYENLVAEILAEQLGARVSYLWTPINSTTVRRHLEAGDCDVVMSAGEGTMGLLNTVAYYRIPHVFLYRSDSRTVFESLYDEKLKGMRIAAVPNTATHGALFELGLANSFIGINPNVSVRGPARVAPTVEALLAGEVDVAIVPGAVAGAVVRESGGALSLAPVQPELVPPLTPMFQLATIGVRAHDEGLRDALNRALAERWDDVQQVFVDLGVPLLPSQPVAPGQPVPGVFRVGVVAPFPTSFPKLTDEVADSVYFGARLADDLAARGAGREGFSYELVYANAPSVESVERAVDRLVALNEVQAVVSGLGSEATRALAERAAELGVVHLNALSPGEATRNARCYPTTFNVAPSRAMYAHGMVLQALGLKPAKVAVVHTDVPESADAARTVIRELEASGVEVVAVEVEGGPVFSPAKIRELTESGADLALAFLEPDAQEMFLFEVDRDGGISNVIGYPWPAMQTRSFYYRLAQMAPELMSLPRLAGWEGTLTDNGADEVNIRYLSRSGKVMDVAAWATYAAIDAAIGAGAAARNEPQRSLAEVLLVGAVGSGLLKGEGLTFDPETHQLEQPLYLVKIDPDRSWSQAVSARAEIASLAATLPPLGQSGATTASATQGGCD